MKSLQCQVFSELSRQNRFHVILFLFIAVSVGCNAGSEPAALEVIPVVESTPGTEQAGAEIPDDFLACRDCELVEVIEIVDANTLRTTVGDIAMYGAYVIDQPADCAMLATKRLTVLAADYVRIEPGPANTVRNSSNHYYLYTADGRSIGELLVREGLALNWTQDGQHLGWFVFRGAAAKSEEAGCLWKDYNAFQRGEQNEFRIPGLTYPDTDQ